MISLGVVKRCAGLLAALIVVAVAWAPSAGAPGYSVYADCERSDGWHAQADENLGAYRTCDGGWLAGLRTLVSVHEGSRHTDGAASWKFSAPTGTRITGLQWSGNKYHGGSSVGGGWAYRTGMFGDAFRAIDSQADCYTHNMGSCYSGAASNPNPKSVSSHYVAGLNEGVVGFYTRCVPGPNNCVTGSDGLAGHNFTRSALVVNDIRVDLRDDWNPSLGGLVEVTPSSAGWHRGKIAVRFDASDNSGIARTAVHGAGNAVLANRPRPCDFFRPKPCNDYSGADGTHTIDTTDLADGRHPLTGHAWDAAGRAGTTAVNDIYVDNHAPAKPPTISIEGGEGWSSTRTRTVRWTLPSQGSGSPVARFHTRVCKVGGTCVDDTVNESNATSWQALEPTAGPGEYIVRVALGDQAGMGAWSDPVEMRFDDVAPGAAEPRQSNGWLNAVERAGYRQFVKLEEGARTPVSGVAGYSITVDGSEPDATIEASGDIVEYPIDDLPEGVTTIKARAVSGAGIASAEVRSVEVKVDLSKPIASVDGAPEPARWQNRPVDLTLRGTDQPALSGMEPAPQMLTIEEGAYIAYRIDGGELQKVRGGSAPVSVADEGEHTITYYAVDLAGNESETQTVQFKIDRTSPVAGATSDAIDPAVWQREAVTVTLAGDDGSGRSGMDPAPEGQPIENGGHLVYRLNAGSLQKASGASATFRVEDDGDHHVEYYAVDGAGNESEHKTLRFRIDRTQPTPVEIEELRSDNRRIEVVTADATSGVAEVQVGLRRIGDVSQWAATRRLARRRPAHYRRTSLRGTRRVGNRVVDCRRKRGRAKRRCLKTRRKQLARHRIAPLGDGWRMLPATAEGHNWVALLPADRSLEPGVYQLMAVVQDHAGNETWGDKFRSGAPARIDPCLAPNACKPAASGPKTPQGPGSPGGGRAPLDPRPDSGTINTRVAAGAVQKVRIKTKVSRKCKRPRTRALKKKCARARKPKYRLTFGNRVKVTRGRAARIKGTVTTAAGAPIAGGKLDVISTANAAGHVPRVVAAVATDASGGFSYTAPAGTSRKVTFRFRGLGRYRRSEGTVDVLVPAAAKFASSRRSVANGQSVVFRGRVLTMPLPARGKVVDLQVFYRGKWRTFGAPRARKNGRFKFKYRFEATRRTTTYRFRARVRPESAYPYELGYSKVVRVRVLGR